MEKWKVDEFSFNKHVSFVALWQLSDSFAQQVLSSITKSF